MLATGCEDKNVRVFYLATNSEQPLKVFSGIYPDKIVYFCSSLVEVMIGWLIEWLIGWSIESVQQPINDHGKCNVSE